MRTKLTELADLQKQINSVFIKFGFEFEGRRTGLLHEFWLWRKAIGTLHPTTKQHYPIFATIKRGSSFNPIVEFHYEDIDATVRALKDLKPKGLKNKEMVNMRVALNFLRSYTLGELGREEFTLEKLNKELEEFLGHYA